MPTTSQKVALITGATQGIGPEIARQLGRHDIIVVLGARDLAKGEAVSATLRAEGLNAHAVKLDVTSAADIAALPGFFESRFGRLDILVNNAGVMIDRGGADSAKLRATFEVNVFGPFAVTEALLPLLKAAPAGRIVNHSSQLGSLGAVTAKTPTERLLPAYASSKAALNVLTIVAARQLSGTKIKVNAAHPGWVRTNLGGANAALEVTVGAQTAVRLALLPDDGPTGGFFHLEQSLAW